LDREAIRELCLSLFPADFQASKHISAVIQEIFLATDIARVICAAIGNAFAVLSDPQKRKRYDEYGSDETELRRRGRPNGYEYDFSRGFEGRHHTFALSLKTKYRKLS